VKLTVNSPAPLAKTRRSAFEFNTLSRTRDPAPRLTRTKLQRTGLTLSNLICVLPAPTSTSTLDRGIPPRDIVDSPAALETDSANGFDLPRLSFQSLRISYQAPSTAMSISCFTVTHGP